MFFLPCVLQRDSNDCGPACVATIALYYKKKFKLTYIRETIGTDNNGSNIYGMVSTLTLLGFDANAVKGDFNTLIESKDIIFPIIAHTLSKENFEHYVVIYKITKNKVIIADPAVGIKKYSFQDFKKIWTGVIIIIHNNNNFFEEQKERNLLSIIFENFSKNKGTIIKIILISFLITILGILSSFYFKFIIDTIIPNEAIMTLTIMMIGLILFNIVGILIELFRSYLLLFYNQNTEFSILYGSLSHLIDLPISFFDSRKTGELITKITDISKIRGAIEETILIFFVDIPMSIITGIILFVQNKLLFFIAAIQLLLYILSTFFSKASISKTNKTVIEDSSKMLSSLIEVINGIENIKSYNLQKYIKNELERVYLKLLNSTFKMNLSYFYPTTFNVIVSKVGVFVIVWVGALEIIKGNISLGEFLVFESLLAYFLNPIKNIINFYPQIQTAKIAISRLNDILDNEIESSDPLLIPSFKEDIFFKKVNFNYKNKKKCLDDITLLIKKGEKVAFVGESGSGKTTLLKLLIKFYDIQDGNIFIGGYNIKDMDTNFIREHISYVSQNSFLFNRSIKDNLNLDNKFSFEETISIIKKFDIFNFLETLPGYLNYLIEENGKNLSTGQKQKLAILKAVLKKPDIIIMDEATSNMDSITESKVQEFINYLFPKITTIIISHRLNIVKNCNVIFVIDNGKLVESGTHEDLISLGGKYNQLWKEQYKSYEI